MKTYRNALALILTLAVLATFTGLASAQGHGMRGQGMMGGGMNTLTPEQQTAMQKLHAEHTAATAELRKQIFAKESELNALLYADKTDNAKIDALTKDIGVLHAELYTDQVALRKQLAKEGITPMSGMGCGMMGGKGGMKMNGGGMGAMNCPMMNSMNADNGTAPQAPADHGAHGTTQQ